VTAYDERSGYRERMLKAEARAEAAEKERDVGREFERWFGKLLTSEGLRLATETEDTLVYVARDNDFTAISLTVRKKNLPNPPPKRLIVTTSYQPKLLKEDKP
jgi:hypothetical protein